jgi:tetratricopeptide (TPR) repeat protein
MKGLWLVVVIALLGIDPRTVSRINSLKEQARKAYASGDYTTASHIYRQLVDSLGVTEEEVKLNLAHALFAANDSSAADRYQPLTVSRNTKLRSIAQQQMGVLANRNGNMEGALEWFKQALRTNPANEDARYNYELVKKKLDEKQNSDKKNDKKDEPSDYAKELKRLAEALVRQQKYSEAHKLMVDGLKKDRTVALFNDFIQRLKDVSELNR